MSADIASLSIRVESLEAKVAGKRLQEMGRRGKRAQKDINGLSKTAAKLGKALAGLFAARAVAGVFVNITKTAAKFEASISELSAITGAAGEDLEFLSDKAKEFGRNTTLSASQAAEAFKLVASAKPDLLENGQALARVTENAIVLAEATGSTLPDAAKTLGSALNQFGAGAEEADRFINVLAAGAQKGASFVNETAEALKYAGTVASTVGVSFEQTNAAIQQLSTVGIKASEAGTALRNTFLKLEGQQEERFKPSVVGIVQALKNLNEAQLTTTELTELFGLRSVVAAQNLILNAEAVEELEGKLTDTSTAYDQQATKIDNLEGSLKQLASATEGLTIRIGEGLEPTQRTLVDTLTDSTNALTSFLGKAEDADDSFGVLDFILKGTIKTLFRLGVEFADLGDIVGAFAVQAAIKVEKVGKEFVDLGDAMGAFAARAVQLATLDFEAADAITADRAARKAAHDEEMAALDDRYAAVSRDREATRAALEEEIALFNSRVDFGDAQTENEQRSIANQKEKNDLTEEELELRRKVAEEEARLAAVADDQTKIDDISDKYKSDVEKAEEAAAEQIRILENLGEVTEAQERERADLIRRIRGELANFKAEKAQEAVDATIKAGEAELKAERDRIGDIFDIRAQAFEGEAKRIEESFDERRNAILRAGEEEGRTQRQIDRALIDLELEHQDRLAAVQREKDEQRIAAALEREQAAIRDRGRTRGDSEEQINAELLAAEAEHQDRLTALTAAREAERSESLMAQRREAIIAQGAAEAATRAEAQDALEALERERQERLAAIEVEAELQRAEALHQLDQQSLRARAEARGVGEAEIRAALEAAEAAHIERMAAIRDEGIQRELEQEQKRADAKLEFEILAAESEVEREQIRFEKKRERLLERGEQLQIDEALVLAAIERLEEEHQKTLDDIRIRGEKKRQAREERLQKQRISGQLRGMVELTQGVAQHSKTLFNINKAAALAEAAINLPEHVSETMSKYPYPISVAMGALAAAASLAQINAIRSTSFEGGGGGTTPSAAGTVPVINDRPASGASDDLLNPPQASVRDEPSRAQVIVTGNVGFTPEIIDQIADGLRDATNERDVVIFDRDSRQAQDLAEARGNG